LTIPNAFALGSNASGQSVDTRHQCWT